MPSPRRMRLLMLAAVATIVIILFYSSHDSPLQDSPGLQGFYQRTKNAMDGHGADAGTDGAAGLRPADRDRDGDIDDADETMGAEMQERLKAAESKAKELANEKAGLRPDPPSKVNGVGSSADGQAPDAADGTSADSVSSSKGNSAAVEEARDTEAELTAILKKSPTIIFSKSYCPHSKRAKHILLDKYSISPEPHVVELDEHEMGAQLQDALKEKTGRRTVPNVLINGVSIGGADEVAELDEADELISKFVDLGTKRLDIAKRPGSRGSRS